MRSVVAARCIVAGELSLDILLTRCVACIRLIFMAVSIGVALSQILSFIDVVLFVTQSHDENECKFNCFVHFLSCMRVT